MERQTEGNGTFPEFLQRIFERAFHQGKLNAKRDALLRLLTHAGIALTEDEAARIRTCEDAALLDRWLGNILGAKTASDVFC